MIVEDTGTLVLGGLIEDAFRERVERVPVLGSIPLLGALFRSTSTTKIKTNLMFFIKPTILRNDVQAAFETNAKYNYIREIQMDRQPDNVLPNWEQRMPSPDIMPRSPRGPSPAEAGIDPAEVGLEPDDSQPVIDLRKIPVEPAQGE